MDLINAKKAAIAQSRENKGKPVYINVKVGTDDAGECFLAPAPDNTSHAVYKNGSEIALPVEIAEVAGKPEPIVRAVKKKAKVKSKETASTVAKKKSVSTKSEKSKTKVMAKTAKKAKPAKKAATTSKVEVGAKKDMKVTAIIALTKKGTKVLNHAKKVLHLTYLENMKDKDRSMEVYVAK